MPCCICIISMRKAHSLFKRSAIFLWEKGRKCICRRGMPPKRTADMSWLEPTYIEAQVWCNAVVKRYR